jgi:transposase InsO family protein
MPRYSLSKATVLKWRKRTDVEDRSHRPHTLHTTLSNAQEFLVCELRRSYLFVAIDRATRWVFAKVYPDQTEQSSVDFLARLQAACPFIIKIILTDNGTQFTDRFTSKNKVPSGQHAFDLACSKAQIEHRLIPPRHPQTIVYDLIIHAAWDTVNASVNRIKSCKVARGLCRYCIRTPGDLTITLMCIW